MPGCPPEATILAFVEGGLSPAERSSAERHLAGCDECRMLVSALARDGQELDTEGRPELAATAPAASTPTPAPRSGSSSRAPGPVRVGDVLAGKYEVERVLGMGGMGVVVAAMHRELAQRVALKFLLPAAFEAPGAHARFLREARAAAAIQSEHVARVKDVGTLENGAPYLVMEYLDGQDLGDRLRSNGPLPPAFAVELVLQACEALAEAHQMGIVHRDLKPANLFLTKRADGTPLLKVLDFGISKSDGGSAGTLTTQSVMLGSPRYMSPEQLHSTRDVDARADIWSLGVILFELVTGKAPFTGESMVNLCAAIATEEAPLLRKLVPKAPEVLERAIASCLEKDRTKRIPSVASLALALEPLASPAARASVDRIVRIGSPNASGAATAVSVRTTKQRFPTLAIASAALAVAALVGASAWLVTRAPSTTSAASTPTPPSTISTVGTTAAEVVEQPAATSPAREPEAAPIVAAPAASASAAVVAVAAGALPRPRVRDAKSGDPLGRRHAVAAPEPPTIAPSPPAPAAPAAAPAKPASPLSQSGLLERK